MLEPSGPLGDRRIALLVDGDNAQPSLIEKILAETGRYGLVTVRRIYGDWTEANMTSWKDTLHVHAIQPMQQFRYTTGKNATDSAMIIDAMDILYEGSVHAFCIVSSDSDYTRLATRIREKGLFVMGVGRSSTPKAFVNACQVFVYTENLTGDKNALGLAEPSSKGRVSPQAPSESSSEPLTMLRSALEMAVQEDGWAFLGAVGNKLRQLDPGFDPRTYGCKQLSQLVRAYPSAFEVRTKRSGAGPSVIYVKLRE